MCRWMGSHFHDWIDWNGVAFSIELLEWGGTFSDFWGKKILLSTWSSSVKKFRKLFIKCNNHIALHSATTILTSYTKAQNHRSRTKSIQFRMT